MKLDILESPDFSGLRLNNVDRSDAEFRKILEVRRAITSAPEPRGFSISSAIPIGAGLGSSAALCTALARLHMKDASTEEIARAALVGERLFHGKPSGVDPFTIGLERPIAFEASSCSWQALDTTRFRLEELCFVLKDSGLRHKTSEVIEAVTNVRERQPALWDEIMNDLAQNAEKMIRAFSHQPTCDLGPLMNETHRRLSALGVSCAELDRTVESLRDAGALGAKLTGAGRGGFALGLFHQADAQRLPTDNIILYDL